jgi:hypothetical protein
MSGNYQNITFRGDAGAVTAFLSETGIAAIVAASADPTGFVVVYPQPVQGAPTVADWVAALLSERFPDPVLLAEVHAEETLRLRLFESGEPVDEYRTEPGFFSGEPLPPSGGDAARLAEAFDAPDARAELATLLRAGRYDDEYGFLGASERHRDIVDLLGLPAATIGIGVTDVGGQLTSDLVARMQFVDRAPNRLLHEYLLLAAPFDATEEEIAGTVLPEVIALDLGLEKEEWESRLGDMASIRAKLDAALRDNSPDTFRWHADPHPTTDDPVVCATVTLYALVDQAHQSALQEALQNIADRTGSTVFDRGTRRVRSRPAV